MRHIPAGALLSADYSQAGQDPWWCPEAPCTATIRLKSQSSEAGKASLAFSPTTEPGTTPLTGTNATGVSDDDRSGVYAHGLSVRRRQCRQRRSASGVLHHSATNTGAGSPGAENRVPPPRRRAPELLGIGPLEGAEESLIVATYIETPDRPRSSRPPLRITCGAADGPEVECSDL